MACPSSKPVMPIQPKPIFGTTKPWFPNATFLISIMLPFLTIQNSLRCVKTLYANPEYRLQNRDGLQITPHDSSQISFCSMAILTSAAVFLAFSFSSRFLR